MSKSVFVEVATQEFGIGGRPTNVSRVSILTGISRKEIKRQRDLLAAPLPLMSEKTTDATRLLSGWYQDDDFNDANGKPLPLALSGSSPNFSDLFSRYGGDTPEQTMIKELKTSNSVRADEHEHLIALSRYYMPGAMTENNIRLFGTNLGAHAETLANNIASGANSTRRIEGVAVDDRIDPEHVAAFNIFIEAQGQHFLEQVDDWLSQHRVAGSAGNKTGVRLGAGLYAFESNPTQGIQS